MSLKAHTNFLAAFEPNQVYESLTEGRTTSDVVQAGDSVLPSGRIIACDPGWLWCKDVAPFRRFLEKSIEHPDFERLEVAIRLSRHRPSWVQLSDNSLNDRPSNPDCIVVLEGQGRQPWSVNFDAGDRYFAERCMFLGSIEEDRWYREHWFNEPLPANTVLKMTFTAEVYPLQPVTTNP